MYNLLDRRTSSLLKGVALLMMFVHHFLTFPKWYIDGIDSNSLGSFTEPICIATKSCVAVFAFLTGFFYQSGHKCSYKYSLKKISDILLNYWIVYIPFLLFAIMIGCYKFNILDFVLESFAIKTDIMIFCWYVNFYICSMLLLPLVNKICVHIKSPIIDFLVVFMLLIIFKVISVSFSIPYVNGIFISLYEWFPYIFIGYLFSKYEFFEKIYDNIIFSGLSEKLKYVVCVLLSIAALVLRNFNMSLAYRSISIPVKHIFDIIMSTFLIYSLIQILYPVRNKKILSILSDIGNKSMLMWFLHCIFFNVCKDKIQNLLLPLKSPVLILIVGFILCYLIASLLQPLCKILTEKKNKILRL